MTALLNAANHALAFTAPVPEAAMFAATWVILLAAVGISRAAAAAWRRVRGGWLDEWAGVEVLRARRLRRQHTYERVGYGGAGWSLYRCTGCGGTEIDA